MTMTLVSTVTVGSGGAASIDFNSVPQSGTDLMLLISARTANGSNAGMQLRFNNDSATNYSYRRLLGDGSIVQSNSSSAINYAVIGTTRTGLDTETNTFVSTQVYIPNYTSSTSKSLSADHALERNGSPYTQLAIHADSWSGTAAITTITITSTSNNFDQYSTASLYTITKGSGGATVS